MTDVVPAKPKSRSALTELMLANARKPLSEVAKLTGLGEKELAVAYARLFEDHGWRTERQEERLFLIEAADLIEKSNKELDNVQDSKEFAAVARVIWQGMQMVADRFDKRKRLVEDDINQITAANARLFAMAYDVALQTVIDGLRVLHPQITEDEAFALSQEGLEKAKKMLEANVNL